MSVIVSVTVQAYYQQLTVDLLTAAAFTTDLLNGNLTRSDWLHAGDYLDSYSINYYDYSYRYLDSQLTTNSSVYFTPVIYTSSSRPFLHFSIALHCMTLH